MSYNTTPLFGRQSFLTEDNEVELNISPTQPLDLRMSIIKAQKRTSSQAIRISTIAQRLTNDSKHVSIQSTNTYTSNDTFLTANSREAQLQNDLSFQQSHPFTVFTKSKEQLHDVDVTPVVKESTFIDVTTPKASKFELVPPEEELSNSPNPIKGLGLTHSNHTPEFSYDVNQTVSDTEEGDTTHEFTFDSYGKFAHNGTLISAGDTITTTPPSTEGREHCINPRHTERKSPGFSLSEENLAYLFIIAVHSFNVSSLENKEDAAICISFEKGDVAFVHSVDESGWGEVTLIKDMRKGWVPFNYFGDAVKEEKQPNDKNGLNTFIDTRKPLEQLLSATAKFILHPQDSQVNNSNEYSFRIEYINSIRDGVKTLLQETDCVSRSNAFVQKKPMIKKMRKRLLAEWYNLMIKADSYKNTTNVSKIDTLVSLTFAVLRKAFLFYEIWSVEKRSYDLEKTHQIINKSHLIQKDLRGEQNPLDDQTVAKSCTRKDIPCLKLPPSAFNRLKEIHDILFAYFALILGRLDMVEHSPANCEVLESIVHQVILLLRELLYISQSCSSIIHQKYKNQYENNLDYNLDPLLSLVSELVSSVKVFVTQTIKERIDDSRDLLMKDERYYYTDEGEHMILIVSQMTRFISNAVSGCNNYLKLIGDFQLSDERNYPDFAAIRITPDQFIKKCSSNLIKKLDDKDQFRSFLQANKSKIISSPSYSKNLARFSTIRSGSQYNALSFGGTQMLLDYLPDKKSFFRDSLFEPFAPDPQSEKEADQINDIDKMKDEIVFDKNENLAGISFRALVFMITDEMRKSDDNLLYTFLLNYKSFGNSEELIELLISRFDSKSQAIKYTFGGKNGTFSSLASRVRSRRRLVCKVIQLWMESFWDYGDDYKLIALLINFFNEEVTEHLPIEAKLLIEIAAKLYTYSPKRLHKNPDPYIQLIPRNVNPVKKTNSGLSITSSASSSISSSTASTSFDEKFIEKYELTKLPLSSHSTISLPVPILSLGNSSLLTKRNMSDIERIVLTYRDMVGFPNGAITTRNFVTNYSLENLISEWMKLVSNSKNQAPPRNLIHNDLNISELNPLEVSKQISLIESTIFLKITPPELLKCKYSSKNPDLSKSPNVNSIITLTNLLSNYVLESILMPGIPLKKRVLRIKSWLRIALSSLYFRNFNALASIMTTLQSYVISRLSMLWGMLSNEDVELFEYLSKIIHPNNNYKVYRKKIEKLVTESSSSSGLLSSKSVLPVVPFFNLFLQDLTFIDEGNPNFKNPDSFRPNKLINIDKYFKIMNTVSMMQFFQVGYDLENKHNPSKKRDSFFSLTGTIDIDSKSIKPVAELQEFILFEFWRTNTLYVKDSDRGYTLSLEMLPRN